MLTFLPLDYPGTPSVTGFQKNTGTGEIIGEKVSKMITTLITILPAYHINRFRRARNSNNPTE